MAQITIEELFRGQKYSIHDKANMAYAKRLSQSKMKDPLAGLMMEYVRQTLIAAEQMKKNGDCIAECELGDAVAVLLSEGQNGQNT